MSLQPNRALARIIEQVEHSDWPRLRSRVLSSTDGDEWTRFFDEPFHPRYASPFHFWVHALRDDLVARGRQEDLGPVAGRALCQTQAVDEWRRELARVANYDTTLSGAPEIYRMQANECRRSSVAISNGRLVAHFWGHGGAPSWRRKATR